MTSERDSPAETPDVPDWDDAYIDRVSDRLMFNYDLEKDRRVRGETYTLYGLMNLQTQKQFLHPSINYANHESEEHLFVQRRPSLSVSDLKRAVELAHDLADEWVVADETHFGTDFTFVFVVPDLRADVCSFVEAFSDRTLIKYGYYGHYEISLIVVAPAQEDIVASKSADAAQAFSLWADIAVDESGFVSRLLGRLRR